MSTSIGCINGSTADYATTANTPAKLSVAFCFSIYAGMGGQMLASNVFAALAIIELLTSGLLISLAAFPSLVACLGNFDRIQSYLEAGELPKTTDSTESVLRSTEKGSGASPGVLDQVPSCTDAGNGRHYPKGDSAGLGRASSLSTVAQLVLQPSETTLVLGPGGCGKTTLLCALLGEAQLQCHTPLKLSLDETVAYCAQQAWLFQGSVVSAITMDLHFDFDWYQHVLWVCALDGEFAGRGDSFDIGDSGNALSGGQKHRVVCGFQQSWPSVHSTYTAGRHLPEHSIRGTTFCF